MPSQTTTSVKLDDALKARLQRLAKDRRRTAHWLMREAIEQYVEREEKAEAGRPGAWAAHPADEVAARTEEAHAWLAQLEAKGIAPSARPAKWR